MSLTSSRNTWQVYVIKHRDGGHAPVISQVELEGLTAQPTTEADFVAATLTMKEEAVFYPT